MVKVVGGLDVFRQSRTLFLKGMWYEVRMGGMNGRR
jgi:hypothetical protein